MMNDRSNSAGRSRVLSGKVSRDNTSDLIQGQNRSGSQERHHQAIAKRQQQHSKQADAKDIRYQEMAQANREVHNAIVELYLQVKVRSNDEVSVFLSV